MFKFNIKLEFLNNNIINSYALIIILRRNFNDKLKTVPRLLVFKKSYRSLNSLCSFSLFFSYFNTLPHIFIFILRKEQVHTVSSLIICFIKNSFSSTSPFRLTGKEMLRQVSSVRRKHGYFLHP